MHFLKKLKNALLGKPKHPDYPEASINYPEYPDIVIEPEIENPAYAHLPPCPKCGKKRPLSMCGICNQKFCPDCFNDHRWSHGKSPGYTGKAANYKKE